MAAGAAFLICWLAFSLTCFPTPSVKADGSINLSLQTATDSPNPGDIVTVTVIADNLPHITRFGQLSFTYDASLTEFVSCQPSPELVNYIYTTDSSESGVVKVSAADEMSESLISDAGGFGEGTELSEDPSFYSDSPVILFSISFRVKADAEGVMGFGISETGTFTDSILNNVEAYVSGNLFVTIAKAISSDSSLAGLSITDVALTPVFSPDVTEYTATVNRNVTEVDINTTASNMMASVAIAGASNLQVGENIITIDVTAQDGVSTTQYKIYLNRQEDTLPEGAGVVDAYGKTFSFISLPPDPNLPDGFVQTTRIINGYTVPVYANEGVSSVILYLYDGENSPGFYFYNPSSNTVMPYVAGEAVIRTSRVLTVSSVPSNVSIPEGLTASSRIIGDSEISGYTDSEGTFVCYLRDEDGSRGFYAYDEDSGDFTEYHPVDRTPERIYRIMFIVFLATTVIEAGIIVVILYLIRKIIIIRTKPRPKRV